MNENERKLVYESPSINVEEIRVEQGFALSQLETPGFGGDIRSRNFWSL